MRTYINKSFASDNNSGVHSNVFKEMQAVNVGHTIAYGDDPYTHAAIAKIKEHFGKETGVYFVFAGTGANVLGLKQLTESFHSVLCAESAHIYTDECGAPEKFTGCKLLPIPSKDGKITIDGIQKHMHGIGFEHRSQPRIISISQSTELGTIYTPEEIKQIADYAHQNEMYLHMDGARLANAAASLGVSLRQTTTDAGVDLLSFGGTKNGLMFGECILFFNKKISENFKYIRKQGMQLFAKMRFIAIQYTAYLTDDLWLHNAQKANKMAQLLAEEVEKIPKINITQKVQANAVFAVVPSEYISVLQQKYFFYVWNEALSEVRWMTSFDIEEEDIINFSHFIGEILK